MADSHPSKEHNALQHEVDIDNVVQYRLYPFLDTQDMEESSLIKLSATGADCVHIASEITEEYIWNNDRFSLTIPKLTDGELPFLQGRTDYKDNIEDEWATVCICMELTRRTEGLVVSLEDGDGQFLLIEAAHEIPKWLKPETSENRVFLFGGKVHIVPTPSHPGEVGVYPVSTPTLSSALSLVRKEGVPTEAPQAVQEAILSKTQRFRGDVGACLHRAHCYLPLSAAHALDHAPQLIASAVHALAERLPSDMKVCQKMTHFSPSECVMRRITFSKFLYAKLTYDNFKPPKHSGFKLPPMSHQDYNAHEIGMKLACGLEIVAHQSGLDAEQTSDKVDHKKDPRWSLFLQRLTANGYFRGELEGSRLHTKLLASAQDFFLSLLRQERESDGGVSDAAHSSALHLKRILLTSASCSLDEYKAEEATIQPQDDDSWLHISEEELDSQLAKYTETTRKGKAKVSTSGDANSFDDVIYGLKSFVNKVSGPDGVEFPWTADDSREVTMDPQSVLDRVQSLLGALGKEGSEDDSESDGFTSDSDSAHSGEQEEKEEMLHVMEAMDRELERTEVGKSFIRTTDSTHTPKDLNSRSEMAQGDDKSRQNLTNHNCSSGSSPGDGNGDDSSFQPVDVDLNLVSNILESFASQCGDPGPASNILRTLGISVPHGDDDEDGEEESEAGQT